MGREARSRTAEQQRLDTVGRPESDLFGASEWYEWGPYLAERAWGSVREDYSDDGDAWSSFPHDHARSRAYRWNEDGLAGLCDVRQRLCLALTLWNGRDPILKERIFGLTGPEGNHGEDAKEYWWYVDALPSHAWLRWRYHYPQAAFPYERLVAENGRRGFHDPEYELLDTGVFDEDRYWAVEVTYAKADPVDVLMRITVRNHGPEPDELHVLPTLWFRNRWSWDDGATPKPAMRLEQGRLLADVDPETRYELVAADGPTGAPAALFCENETNTARLFGHRSSTPFPKDGINDHVVDGAATVDPDGTGTKAAWWYRITVEPGADVELRLRLRRVASAVEEESTDPTNDLRKPKLKSSFTKVMTRRQREADEFYAALVPDGMDTERATVVREASAGLVWTKQYYAYRVARWLDGDPGQPAPPPGHRHGRNAGWRHLDADDILAMPDPWEYPWFAAWDLAFHAIAWAHLDPSFAKYQLLVLLREWFLNPNGALPAYEWTLWDGLQTLRSDDSPPPASTTSLRPTGPAPRSTNSPPASASTEPPWPSNSTATVFLATANRQLGRRRSSCKQPSCTRPDRPWPTSPTSSESTHRPSPTASKAQASPCDGDEVGPLRFTTIKSSAEHEHRTHRQTVEDPGRILCRDGAAPRPRRGQFPDARRHQRPARTGRRSGRRRVVRGLRLAAHCRRGTSARRRPD
jgi:hypothetical protein